MKHSDSDCWLTGGFYELWSNASQLGKNRPSVWSEWIICCGHETDDWNTTRRCYDPTSGNLFSWVPADWWSSHCALRHKTVRKQLKQASYRYIHDQFITSQHVCHSCLKLEVTSNLFRSTNCSVFLETFKLENVSAHQMNEAPCRSRFTESVFSCFQGHINHIMGVWIADQQHSYRMRTRRLTCQKPSRRSSSGVLQTLRSTCPLPSDDVIMTTPT